MLISAFILGLLGSFHCVGMCGPIAFLLPVNRHNNHKKLLQITIYHFGRLLAYSIIGLIFGLVGKGLFVFGFQQQLSIGIGVFMLAFILIPQKTFHRFYISKFIYKSISKVKSALGTALKKKTNDTFLTIGLLNGFLPCGLVYMAVLASIASGTAFNGSLYMVFFGLGTISLMTTAIYFSQFLKATVRQKIQNIIPFFVVVIALLFIIRGMGFGIPYLSPAPAQDLVSNAMNCH